MQQLPEAHIFTFCFSALIGIPVDFFAFYFNHNGKILPLVSNELQDFYSQLSNASQNWQRHAKDSTESFAYLVFSTSHHVSQDRILRYESPDAGTRYLQTTVEYLAASSRANNCKDDSVYQTFAGQYLSVPDLVTSEVGITYSIFCFLQ